MARDSRDSKLRFSFEIIVGCLVSPRLSVGRSQRVADVLSFNRTSEVYVSFGRGIFTFESKAQWTVELLRGAVLILFLHCAYDHPGDHDARPRQHQMQSFTDAAADPS